MKHLLITLLFSSCLTTLKVQVDNCYSNTSKTVLIKAKKSICIASFKGDTIEKLVDSRNKILVDSVCDYKVLYLKK